MDELSVLSRSDAAVRGDLPDETVLLDTASGILLRLNGAAEMLWERLAEPCTLAELADALAERYGIEPDVARNDAEAFARDMLARELISAGIPPA